LKCTIEVHDAADVQAKGKAGHFGQMVNKVIFVRVSLILSWWTFCAITCGYWCGNGYKMMRT
jgi:hypothetical protein